MWTQIQRNTDNTDKIQVSIFNEAENIRVNHYLIYLENKLCFIPSMRVIQVLYFANKCVRTVGL